jgi:hypothetical protein
MSVVFNPKTGRYRNAATGRFVSRADGLKLVDTESARVKFRLQGHTRLLLSEKISLSEWEKRMAETIKESHIRMTMLGAGGKNRASNAHFGAVGATLRREYRYLHLFSNQISRGELTSKRILSRAGSYAASTRKSFYKGEQLSRAIAGVKLAKRDLDPQARHCTDCIGYSTNGEWLPIEMVVVPGHACQCGGRCRCSIYYKMGDATPIMNLSDRLDRIAFNI